MKCTECGEDIILQCSDDEPKRIAGKPVCHDCYFRQLGDMMEQHPPGFPHMQKLARIMLDQTIDPEPQDGALELRCAILWHFSDQIGQDIAKR